MKTLLLILICSIIISCNITKIDGERVKKPAKKSYKGWRWYEDKYGNLIPVCRSRRKSFTH